MGEIVRYGLAGGVNTLVGYCAFLVAYHVLSISPSLSNVIAYVAGLACAYILNKYFVFQAKKQSQKKYVWRFLVAFVIAFALNQAVLLVLHYVVGWAAEWAQLWAMLFYTVVFYLLNKWYVFAGKADGEQLDHELKA